MQLNIDGGAVRIIERLEMAKFETYVVGETVRDLMMNVCPHEFDIVTSAAPEQVKLLFQRTVNYNPQNGTINVIIDGTSYKVSSFERLPDKSYNKKTDFSKFDFTINSMAYSHVRGLRDYFGGAEDLKNKFIRCVGNSEEKFKNEPICMLRAVRFAVVFGFDIEENTKKAMKKCAPLVRKIKAEVVRGELDRILMSDNPERIVLMHELGLLKYIIPELDICFGEPQRNKYHIYDVGMHIMKALENLPRDLTVRWAVLLHDIGKPNCSSTDANGVIHFYGHHKESQKIANDVLHRLHFDSETIQNISVLVENHDVRIDASVPSVKRMMAKVGEELFEKLMTVQEADSKAKNPIYIDEKLARINSVRSIFKKVLAEHQPYSVNGLAVTNRDLMKLGFKTGREVADVLRILLEDVIVTPEYNNRDYLLKKAKLLRRKKGFGR